MDDVQRSVNALVPFVTLAFDYHGGFLIASDVGHLINLDDGAGNRGVDIGADEGFSLADELSHLHLVAFLHDGGGGGTEVLGHIDDRFIGQREGLHGCGVREFVGFGVHTAHAEGLVAHFFDVLSTLFDVVFNSLFEGCDCIFHFD